MKKHLLILFPVMALLLAGCSGGEEQPTTSEEATSSAPATSIAPPTTGPAPSDNHLIGIAWSGITQDFVTSVGDSVTLKISYQGGSSTSAIPDEEKGITWTTSNSSVATIPTDDNDNNIDVSFVGAGSVTITATSIWNSDYTKSIGVTVYENDAYHYVWSCGTGDKDKFAAAEGDAMLNGASWHYLRAKPSDPAGITGSQSLKFGGKVSTDKPNNNEGAITLTLNNTKVVKQIIVSASSGARPTGVDDQGHETTERYGSSKLTMMVGSTVYYPETSTPKGDTPETINSNIPTTLGSGNIVISFTESVSYICLKSIIIIYDHSLSEIVVSPTSPHKVLFEVGDSFSADGLVVYAHYVNDPVNYDVTSSCNILAPNLSSQGVKTVNITYTEGSIARNTSYNIDVNPHRNVVSVEITGSIPAATKYYVGDTVDYSALKVLVTWDAVDIHDSLTSELALPTANGGDFTEVTNIHETAVLDMNGNYTMSLKYKGELASKDITTGNFVVVDLNVVFDFTEGEGIVNNTWYGQNYATNRDITDGTSRVNVSGKMGGLDGEGKNADTDNYPGCNDSGRPILIKTIDDNFSIKSVSLEFVNKSESKRTFKLKESPLDGIGFGEFVAEVKGDTLNYTTNSYGIKSLLLSVNAGSSYKIGYKKFTITLAEQDAFEVDELTYEGTLAKTQYIYGVDTFDPTGITVYANPTDTTKYSRVDVSSSIQWGALTSGTNDLQGSLSDPYSTKLITVPNIKAYSPTSISYTGTPDKTTYNHGEAFDPTGITVFANFDPAAEMDPIDITSYAELVFADADESKNYITAKFNDDDGLTVNITGITVNPYAGRTFNKVTSDETGDLSGTYLIVSTAKSSVLNGSLTKSELDSDNHLAAAVSGASYVASYVVDQATVTITKLTEGTYAGFYVIKTMTDVQIGITASGSLSTSTKEENSVAISFEEGNAIITNNGRPGATGTKYLGCATAKFSTYANTNNAIQLYKLAS